MHTSRKQFLDKLSVTVYRREDHTVTIFCVKFALCDSFLTCKTSGGKIRKSEGYQLCKHVFAAYFFSV